MKVVCGRTGQEEDLYDDEIDEQNVLFDQDDSDSGRPFYWTRQLQQSFWEELEKCTILFVLETFPLTLASQTCHSRYAYTVLLRLRTLKFNRLPHAQYRSWSRQLYD
jgi:hypothetical protein